MQRWDTFRLFLALSVTVLVVQVSILLYFVHKTTKPFFEKASYEIIKEILTVAVFATAVREASRAPAWKL